MPLNPVKVTKNAKKKKKLNITILLLKHVGCMKMSAAWPAEVCNYCLVQLILMSLADVDGFAKQLM